MNEPSYYAVIPANVRYSKKLCASAKLLFGEITALANAEGFCWAGNEYFAGLYDVSVKSVSSWIGELCEAGFIRRELQYKPGTKEITGRKIFLEAILPSPEKLPHLPTKTSSPTHEKVIENTTKNITLEKKEYMGLFSEEPAVDGSIAGKVLEYLNHKTGAKFKSIKGHGLLERIKEGYTFDQFMAVIDRKIQEWKGTEFEKFLTPDTLFRVSKFEKYVNDLRNPIRKSGNKPGAEAVNADAPKLGEVAM